jgi:hypothetical protein
MCFQLMNCINQNVNFNPPFFYPPPLGFLPTRFKISLNNLIVVESIKRTLSNVNPYFRLYDKFNYCIFANVIFSLCKNQITIFWENLLGVPHLLKK